MRKEQNYQQLNEFLMKHNQEQLTVSVMTTIDGVCIANFNFIGLRATLYEENGNFIIEDFKSPDPLPNQILMPVNEVVSINIFRNDGAMDAIQVVMSSGMAITLAFMYVL